MRAIHKEFVLSTTPTRIEMPDAQRIGMIFQNQPVNACDIYLSADGANSDRACIMLAAGGILYEDIIPATGDIWARSTVAGAILTVVVKYRK